MIVMKPTATEDEVEPSSSGSSPSARSAPQPRRRGDRDRRHRRPRARRPPRARGRARRRPGRPDPQAVQARLARSCATASASVLEIGGRQVGGDHFALIAGPCTVESRDQTLDDGRRRQGRRRDDVPRRRLQAAHLARTPSRASVKRACACSQEAKERTGLPIVTELMDARDLEAVAEVADVIQIGARNMQNYPLLTEVGRSRHPGADQARPVAHARGAAHGGGVRPQGGQRERDALRARHPHVRDRLPLHARPHRDPGAQGADAPAGHRRPQPRGRAAATLVDAAVARRGRGRAPTGSSSRSTPSPRRRSATGRSSCAPTDFADYAAQVEQAAAVAGKALERRGLSRVQARGHRRRAHRRVGRPGRPQRLGADGRGLRPRRGGAAHGVERGAHRRGASTSSPTLAGADAAVVAVPVPALPTRSRDVLRAPARSAVVTDVGSTKRALVEAIDDERFVGGHPLAGAEAGGVAHAREDLFDGATWYLTPGPASEGVLLRAPAPLRRRPRRARRRRSTPRTHDRLMAAVSHLPHVVANVLVAQAAARWAASTSRRPARASATPPASRAPTRRCGRASTLANRDALAGERRRGDRAARATSATRLRRRRATLGVLAGRTAREQRRALLEVGLTGGERAELRVVGAQPPGRRSPTSRWPSAARVSTSPTCRSRPRPTSRSGEVALWVRRRPTPTARADADRRASACRSPGERPLRPRRAAARRGHAAGRQVDLAPRRDPRRDGRRARRGPQLPRRRGHELDARTRCASLGALVEERPRTTRSSSAAPGLREAHAADEPIDVGNAGTLMRLLPGLARRAGGPVVHARRRRVDPPAPGRPHRRAAASRWARGSRRATGRFPPFTVHGARLRAIDYDLPVASAQVKSCVLLAGARRRRRDDDRRAVAQPRPHRADARRRRRHGAPQRPPRHRRQLRRARPLDEIVVPGDLSLGRVPRSPPACSSRGSRLVIAGVDVNWTRTGFLRIVQRMGGIVVGDLEEEPGDEIVRRASRSSDLDVDRRPAGRHGRRGRRGAARDRRAAARRAARLLRRGRDRRARRRGAARQGVRPHRGGRRRPARPRRATSRRRRTASSSRAPAACAAARSPRSATTASRWSARSPAWRAHEGVEVAGMEAADVSYPTFTRGLRARLPRRSG